MMMFVYVFHFKVIGFNYGVACGLVREGCLLCMQVVMGNRTYMLKHLCPRKRVVWLKLLDEVRGTKQTKQALNHVRS